MTFDEIAEQTEHPSVEVDENGFITGVRNGFQEMLGWQDSLIGRPLSAIIPAHMHDAHHMGFSRFVATGQPHLLESDVRLPTSKASSEVVELVHHIAAKRFENGEWRFISMVREI